jgi:hypothetical protein
MLVDHTRSHGKLLGQSMGEPLRGVDEKIVFFVQEF